MALENLFIRKKRGIAGIQLDAVISESHSNSVRVTKNPIEYGADVADHAIIEPKKLLVNAVVSDTPLGLAAITEIIDNITGFFGSSTSDNLTRSETAYNALIALQNTREPVSIVTGLDTYENMVITNISVRQDAATSKMVDLFITMEEVLITESEIIQLEPTAIQEGSARVQSSSAVKSGRKETITPAESTQKSMAKTIIDWVGS